MLCKEETKKLHRIAARKTPNWTTKANWTATTQLDENFSDNTKQQYFQYDCKTSEEILLSEADIEKATFKAEYEKYE